MQVGHDHGILLKRNVELKLENHKYAPADHTKNTMLIKKSVSYEQVLLLK